jgi:hypothetical protein
MDRAAGSSPGGTTRVRAVLDIAACGFLPGALAGVHLAGLIFFLNPGLPFTLGPVLRGVLVYGTLLGLASLALHFPFTWPFTWRSAQRARRVLPWGLTVALATAALLDWTHASRYAYFLPPGINERLIKTALWLTLGALICFYTALLHSLHRRRYGVRSRTGIAVLAVLSVYAMVERREAFRPRPGPAPRPAAVEAGPRTRLWVVGLDAATLDAILPLAGQGRLPFLASVLQGGAYGRLESISPPRPEALWTTLATGKYPYKHGVTGGQAHASGFLAPGSELRLLPSGISFPSWGTLGNPGRPPRTQVREALTLWEILPRLGMPAAVAGWPASPTTSGRRTPDAEAVFLAIPGLRELSRDSFGGFQAVQFEGSQEPAARAAAERLADAYERLDRRLGEIWSRGSGPRVLAVVSAHGVEARGGWRGPTLKGSFGGAPDGVLLLYGEGVRPGALLTGARLVDVTPTLLYGLGFPVARDLDGHVLTAAYDKAFLARHPLTFLPSYEALEGAID